MSFATLEEAWGLSSFAIGGGASGASGGGPMSAAVSAAAGPGRGRRGGDSMGGGMGGGMGDGGLAGAMQARPRAPLAGAGARGRGDSTVGFAPAPGLMPPQLEDGDDIAVQNTRKFLARTYARYGTAGLMRLMPREAAGEVGRGMKGRRHRSALGDLWDDAVKFVACPEKMLFVLLCIFAMLVVWDSWRSDSAASAAATMASMHMTPFPMGGSN